MGQVAGGLRASGTTILSGEDHMSHSLRNLDHQQFKYPMFRRPVFGRPLRNALRRADLETVAVEAL